MEKPIKKIVNLRTGRTGMVIGSASYDDKRLKARIHRSVWVVRQDPDGKLTQWAKDACVNAAVFFNS